MTSPAAGSPGRHNQTRQDIANAVASSGVTLRVGCWSGSPTGCGMTPLEAGNLTMGLHCQSAADWSSTVFVLDAKNDL